MQPKQPRPTGVTILGVLAILGGLGSLAVGAVLMLASIVIGALVSATEINNQLAASGYPGLAGLGVGLIALFLLLFGIVFLVLGILYLVTGIGLFGGKSWAWTLGILVSVIGLVLSIVQIAIGSYGSVLGLVIDVLIIYYLTRPHVKSFFGRGPAVAPMTQPSGQM